MQSHFEAQKSQSLNSTNQHTKHLSGDGDDGNNHWHSLFTDDATVTTTTTTTILPKLEYRWTNFDQKQYLSKDRLLPGEDAYSRNKFNQRASDDIAPDRPLMETRSVLCKRKHYDVNQLPSTSVIITFHNEARSTLLRTIVSVFNRSPAHLITEIILVDDFSDDPSNGQELATIGKVKVIRNAKREGLVRSRIVGSDVAKGPILTFLDSHCECNTGWLEPLLDRVREVKNEFFLVYFCN